jgi:IS30 family transposase
MNRRYLFHKCLRRKHHYRIKRCQRKPRIPKEILITSRPDVINKRDEFGHWECDLMIFKKGVKTNLITLRERKSRYLIAIKNENREAAGTALALISKITKIKNHVKSITFDQGSEFKKYEWIKSCIGADIYFCEPASPHQKGCIENGNANIRIEFQRDYDAEKLKQRHVEKVIKNINDKPLKCLGYKTPTEEFYTSIRIIKDGGAKI